MVLLALHGLVVLSVLGLALLRQMPVEAAGWVIRPAVYEERWKGAVERRSSNWLGSLLAWLSVVCEREEPWVQVERQADGSYQATLCGHFTLAVAGDHPFRLRLLIVFLHLLDTSTAARGSRRTRDGRVV